MSGCGCGGGSGMNANPQVIANNGVVSFDASYMSATQQINTLSPNTGLVEQGYIIPDSSNNPFADTQASTCLTEMSKKTDIIIQQGTSFELRVCLRGVIEQIRCFETTGDLTLPIESCLEANDNVEIACVSDCQYTAFEGEHAIGAVSADLLTVTLNPVPATPTEQRCFVSQSPVIGCLTVTPEQLPVIIELESIQDVNFFGHISRSLPRKEKDFGINTIANSNYVQTTVLNLVRIGDFITIASADINNAEVLNVERLTYNGQTVDVIELDQTPTQSGCFASTIASGNSIDFSVREDGSCVVFYLSAFQTSTMIPLGTHGMTNDGYGTARGHYGFYSLNYSGVIQDPNNPNQIYPVSIPILSGRVLVDYNAIASIGVI